jgi:hypothetical protein
MRRLLQLIVGSLAMLAPSEHVQGQQPPAAHDKTAPAKIHGPKVRVLAIARAPLADRQLPDGGVILALAIASLSRVGSEVDVQWATAAMTTDLLRDPSIDIALPLTGAECDQPNDLARASAALCDHATYSEPILRVVVGLFTLANSPLKVDTDDSIVGKTICIPPDRDVWPLNADGRNWLTYKQVSVLREPTLPACAAAVQRRAADVFLATDLEGQFMLSRLGLLQSFRVAERTLGTRGVHAVAYRGHIQGSAAIDALNRGLRELKQSDAYSAIVGKHVIGQLHPQGSTPTAKPPTAALGDDARALPPRAGPAPPVPLPKMLPGDRERALRLKKKGDDDLAGGRMVPARLHYERAAEMGLAEAAMALAMTYDPGELNRLRLNMRGEVWADTAQAMRWYERARALGASEAAERLQRLGTRDGR